MAVSESLLRRIKSNELRMGLTFPDKHTAAIFGTYHRLIDQWHQMSPDINGLWTLGIDIAVNQTEHRLIFPEGGRLSFVLCQGGGHLHRLKGLELRDVIVDNGVPPVVELEARTRVRLV